MTEIVKMRKEEFKVNTYVELEKMDDTQTPPIGTKGLVKSVDDMGTVHIAWQNGSSLGATLEDSIKKKLNATFVGMTLSVTLQSQE